MLPRPTADPVAARTKAKWLDHSPCIHVQDKRKGTSSYFIVKNEPVDIEKQIQFVFVPGLDVYAAYKVKKLTNYFLILFGIGIPILILLISITGFSYYLLLTEGAVLPVAIYLIRKWSKE